MTNNRYLFRGFHKDENGKETIYLNGEEIKGNWVYGYLEKQLVDGEEYYITSPYNEILNRSHVVIPATISQYTGLDDKNGIRVFEGDKVMRDYDWVKPTEIGVVTWNNDNASFQIRGHIPSSSMKHLSRMKIIGTIFDKEVK